MVYCTWGFSVYGIDGSPTAIKGWVQDWIMSAVLGKEN